MEDNQLLELQKARKRNLRSLINELYEGSIDAFAVSVGKHKNFVYSLLWDVDNPNNRAITDKMARLFEKILNLENEYLDKLENTSSSVTDYTYIKFLDIKNSEMANSLVISEKSSFPIIINELFKRNITTSDLIAIRVFDDSMVPFCNFDDVVIIDMSFKELREQQYYLIHYNAKLLIRRLDFSSDGYFFNIESNSGQYVNTINLKTENNKLAIIGIIVFRFVNSKPFIR